MNSHVEVYAGTLLVVCFGGVNSVVFFSYDLIFN